MAVGGFTRRAISSFFQEIDRLEQGPVILKVILESRTCPSKQRQVLKSVPLFGCHWPHFEIANVVTRAKKNCVFFLPVHVLLGPFFPTSSAEKHAGDIKRRKNCFFLIKTLLSLKQRNEPTKDNAQLTFSANICLLKVQLKMQPNETTASHDDLQIVARPSNLPADAAGDNSTRTHFLPP